MSKVIGIDLATTNSVVREFAALQDRVNRMFGDVRIQDGAVGTSGAWTPPVDIFETEGRDLVIKAELPDMTREDIEVTVEHDTLTLRGEKKRPSDVDEDRYRRIERRYGRFSRAFQLPTTVDAARVSAEYKNGVLVVRLPFREESRPRTITVDVAA